MQCVCLHELFNREAKFTRQGPCFPGEALGLHQRSFTRYPVFFFFLLIFLLMRLEQKDNLNDQESPAQTERFTDILSWTSSPALHINAVFNKRT